MLPIHGVKKTVELSSSKVPKLRLLPTSQPFLQTAADQVKFGRDKFLGPAQPISPLRSLFPDIKPYANYRLKVSDLHELNVEEYGNPNGYPVIALHGGPGGGIMKPLNRTFDPKFYRIIQFDQRGCGKSTPNVINDHVNALKENTTADLVEDIEKIRKHLNIDKWLVAGGSWGSTLSLAYSEAHPDKTTGLILRGIFLCRKEDIDWFYQKGASHIQPEGWKDYIKPIPPEERDDMVKAYHKRLTSPDQKVREEAVVAWNVWESLTSFLFRDEEDLVESAKPQEALTMATIENHYFVNGSFFREDNQLIKDAHKISHIPTWIIHGRYDLVCPVKGAVDLAEALPNAQVAITPDAGHALIHAGNSHSLVEASEAFKIQHAGGKPSNDWTQVKYRLQVKLQKAIEQINQWFKSPKSD